jgi:hypothetical protein
MRADDLAARLAAIQWPNAALARAAGVDEDTVTRILKGGNALRSTVAKLDRALTDRELALRDHLNDLHPPEFSTVSGILDREPERPGARKGLREPLGGR